MFWKVSQNSQENTCVEVAFFKDVAGQRSAGLLKKRLQRNCFPVNFEKHLFYRTPPVTAFVCWNYSSAVKISQSVLLNSLCEDIIQQVITNITCSFQSKKRKLWIYEWYNSTPLSFVFTCLYLPLICLWLVFTRLHWPLNCLHSSCHSSIILVITLSHYLQKIYLS